MVNNYFFTESAKSINLEALPGNFGLKKIHFTFLQFLKEKQTNPKHIFAFFGDFSFKENEKENF
jgi:hypothetical protein